MVMELNYGADSRRLGMCRQCPLEQVKVQVGYLAVRLTSLCPVARPVG